MLARYSSPVKGWAVRLGLSSIGSTALLDRRFCQTDPSTGARRDQDSLPADRLRRPVRTGCFISNTRTPATMAQTAATIDELSGGRLSLGLGVWHRPVV